MELVWSTESYPDVQKAAFAGAATLALLVTKARGRIKKAREVQKQVIQVVKEQQQQQQQQTPLMFQKKLDLEVSFSDASTQAEDDESVSLPSNPDLEEANDETERLREKDEEIERLQAAMWELQQENRSLSERVNSLLNKNKVQENQLTRLAMMETKLADTIRSNHLLQADLERVKRLASILEREALDRATQSNEQDVETMQRHFDDLLLLAEQKRAAAETEVVSLKEKYQLLMDQYYEKQEALEKLQLEGGQDTQEKIVVFKRTEDDERLFQSMQEQLLVLTRERNEFKQCLADMQHKVKQQQSLEDGVEEVAEEEEEEELGFFRQVQATAVAGLVAGLLLR